MSLTSSHLYRCIQLQLGWDALAFALLSNGLNNILPLALIETVHTFPECSPVLDTTSLASAILFYSKNRLQAASIFSIPKLVSRVYI